MHALVRRQRSHEGHCHFGRDLENRPLQTNIGYKQLIFSGWCVDGQRWSTNNLDAAPRGTS
jgi:hypothetical protein